MPTTLRPWDAIGALARFVPTPHNTQPYRIQPRSDDTADLVLCCDRLLPDEDPGNAYVLSAFGVFEATLEYAARAHGHEIEVAPLEHLDGAALTRTSGRITVARATLAVSSAPVDPTHATLLALRRTSRLPYHERSIAPPFLAELARTAAGFGHCLEVSSDSRMVATVLQRNAVAIIDNLQDPREREEIRGWHRLGETPHTGDGLWQQPMNQPAWQLRAAFAVPWLFAFEPVKTLAIRRYLRTQRGTRHVAVIGGPFATWPEQRAAGRMLFELWMRMAAADIYMQPFGSMLTNAHHARWVEDALGVAQPWLILRLGYSDRPPASPRLASIVLS